MHVRGGNLAQIISATLFLCLVFLSGNALLGQQLSVISGTIFDPSDALIQHAQVTLSQSGKAIRKGSSDSLGGFLFKGLEAGEYDLLVAAQGFREQSQHLILIGQPRFSIRVKLSVMSASADVRVVAQDSVQLSTEIDQNQSANEMERDALDRLPVFDADYITTMSRFLNADATGTSGVSLVVNGVEANGPGVSASGIQSVKINQNPYTALYAAPGRARIEITTKQGTPQFHGSLNFLLRNSVLDAKNTFALEKPSEKRTYWEGALTGPVPGRKMTFLATANHDDNHQQAVVVAATSSGGVRENVPVPTGHDFYSARLFRDYGNGDQAWVGYSYEGRSTENSGVGGTVLPEAGTNTHFFEHEINVGNTSVFSPHLLNQLHFLVGKNENRVTSVRMAAQIIVSGAFTGGGAQADFYRTENHFDGTDIVTYTKGKQELKFGVDIPDISRRAYVDKTNALGTYTFSSLASYSSNAPSLFVLQRGQPRVVFWETIFGGILEDTIHLRRNLSLAVGARYYYQNYFHNVPTNFAPRFSYAYAPWPKGRTVLRGGAGLFFDRTGPAPISDLLHLNGRTLRRYILSQPAYPVMDSTLVRQPVSQVQLDSRSRIPSVLQYSFAVEEQVARNSTVSVTYIGSRGMNLFRSVDENAPLPPLYSARPNPEWGQVRLIQPEGYSKSNMLEVSARTHLRHFTGQAQYTLGKSYNNTQGITWFPADSHAPLRDWGRSDNDRRHRFDLLGSFTAGHWFILGTAASVYSGLPVNILTGSDSNHDGATVDRPAGVVRNGMHGPSYADLDLNLSHDILLHRSSKTDGPTVSVSASSFNVLNRRNPTTYVGVISSPFFGHAISAQPPRRLQLNLQLKF